MNGGSIGKAADRSRSQGAAALEPQSWRVPEGEAELGALRAPEPGERPDLWPTTLRREASGELSLGGVALSQFLTQAPTPVFAFDEADFRARARTWVAAMKEEFWPPYGMNGGSAFYAGKAFLTTAVARMAFEEGMGIDTASRVEFAVALRAADSLGTTSSSTTTPSGQPGPSLSSAEAETGMPAHSAGHAHTAPERPLTSRIGLHGNGKTVAELVTALRHRVGHVVLDSFEEVVLAAEAVRLLRKQGAYEASERGAVMIRVTTGVHAGGHEYISTAHEDQKFGLSLATGAARATIDAILDTEELQFVGLHSHIGSQIMELSGFREAARKILQLRHEVYTERGVLAEEIDLGGGYGIAYTGLDEVAPSPAQVARALSGAVRELCAELGDPVPHVSIEPGRSVAGPSTVTFYTVTGLKNVELGDGRARLYVSVDGGMSDNIRPALYEAEYTALLANRRPDAAAGYRRARVVGKHCESGDVVVRQVDLPADLAVGDVLAVPATGAYGRSMASSYNLFTRPGVAWVREGKQGWLLRPETLDDLLALEG